MLKNRIWCTPGIHTGASSFQYKYIRLVLSRKGCHFAAYSDDNIPYFCDKNPEVHLSKLQICALKLFEWFSNNYMKMNSDKCHFILSSNDKNRKI